MLVGRLFLDPALLTQCVDWVPVSSVCKSPVENSTDDVLHVRLVLPWHVAFSGLPKVLRRLADEWSETLRLDFFS